MPFLEIDKPYTYGILRINMFNSKYRDQGSLGTCVKRCQMEAVYLNDGKAPLNLDRCIGCGLCVSTCPTNSLSLVRKAEQSYVPKDIIETSIKGKTRGKMGMAKLVGMQVRSKLDRLLAPK